MLGKRIINTGADSGAACTTDTVQILDGVPFQSIATYQLDGNANDLTGNYNGTASNVTYSTGKFGQAAVFQNNVSRSVINVTIPLGTVKTISHWIKFSQFQTDNIHIFSSSSNNLQLVLLNTGGARAFAFYDGVSTKQFGSSFPNDFNWHHLVWVFNGASTSLYLDGSLVSTISTASTTQSDIVIGSNSATSGVIGSIDQVRIYDKALSAADVTTLYNETVATASTNPTFNAPSLVAYYKMSDATDETGSYDGTPTNVNFNVAGKFGNAGEFNGSSSYIESTSLNYSILPTNTAWSASCWINLGSTSITTTAISLMNPSSPFSGWALFVENGRVQLAVNGSSPSATTGSFATLSANTWMHVVLTYNGSGTTTLYYNGNFGATVSSTISASTNGNFRIGYAGGWSYFNGSIDQIRVFDRAITSDEVTTLYEEVYCQPTIVPTDHFEPVIYTGNGTTQSISTLDFAPDFTWIKSRSNSTSHVLSDSVRGANLKLRSNSTAAEAGTDYGVVTSFDNNGFTVGGTIDTGDVNFLNWTYVAWNWKAGGDDVQNTDGTITSQVSANVDAGFSIVSYTANGTDGASIGHGLDSAPEMIIYKGRNATGNWITLTTAIDGSADYLFLNTTAAKGDYASNYIPTDNLFYSISSSSTLQFIAYCFHSVDGMSRIGSYVGTNAAGNSIVTGFRPAFLMTKRSSAAGGGWNIFDNKRGTNKRLYPNLSNAEGTDSPEIVTFNSNGFTFNTADSWNNGAYTYIFMAFAEEVFVADNFFNDDSTVATYKLNGDAGDDSGNGNNGTASNVTYAAGKFDDAGEFNGSSSSILTSSNFANLQTFSVSSWVNFNTVSGTVSIATTNYKQGGASGDTGWMFRLRNGNALNLARVIGGVFTNVEVSWIPSANTWYHVLVTRTSTETKFYVNGVQQGATQLGGSGTILYSSDAKFTIGVYRYINTNYNVFNGSIDQVRIFNRTLDAGEVTQLYNE